MCWPPALARSRSATSTKALIVRESLAAASPASRLHVAPGRDQALRFLRRAGEYAAAPRPALILLGLDLRGPAGLDLLAQVKSDPALAAIAVIVLSGSDVSTATWSCGRTSPSRWTGSGPSSM